MEDRVKFCNANSKLSYVKNEYVQETTMLIETCLLQKKYNIKPFTLEHAIAQTSCAKCNDLINDEANECYYTTSHFPRNDKGGLRNRIIIIHLQS